MGNATALISDSTGTVSTVVPAALLRAEIVAGVALPLADRGLRLIRL